MKRKVLIGAIAVLLVSCFLTAQFSAAGAHAADTAATSARCMAVIECSSKRLLYAKSENTCRPMASTTKICTAITVLENCDDLNKTVTVPDKAVGVEGSSIYLQRGEKVKIIDLLYGLMLQSGNDCAEALAITIGGSIESFAELMNETAAKAGAQNSNFVNPHGLHDDNHYTTAYDLALITAYAFRNADFAEIVSTKKHTMPWEGRDYPRVIVNKNKILSTYEGGDGVKTGFTKKAGRCLVSSATRNGMRVIAVVLDCGPMFEDCSSLMDKAFEEYSMTEVVAENEIRETVAVENGKRDEITVANINSLRYPLKEGEKSEIRTETFVPEKVSAPVEKQTECGKFCVKLKNQLLFDEKLYTIDSVAERGVADKLKDLIEAW